ncbi:TetR/AcrR family transcriptional regulator [Rhodospirillum sp. A1_3_36]|uniref:TetR/AcrR family transcriptional regulator n=1 Tax=Rhodospirillum sp. A1_3_36 TaxID=3391666 RepID=UPI0039A662A9
MQNNSPGSAGPPRNPSRPRRTQEERTQETRAKLISATLDVLLEEGYQNLTTQRICDKAGVSRGAMLHHFPNKITLIVASIEDLLINSTEDIRAQAHRVRDEEISVESFVDYLWTEHFSGRLFYLTLEHVTVARTDNEVRAAMIPVVKRFHQALDETWREFFPAAHLGKGEVTTVLNLTLCLLRGMGVQTVLRPSDPAYYDALRGVWKTMLTAILDGRLALDIPQSSRPFLN